jgi:hypothetical protein
MTASVIPLTALSEAQRAQALDRQSSYWRELEGFLLSRVRCSVRRMNYRTSAFLFGKGKRSTCHVAGEEPWRRRHPLYEGTLCWLLRTSVQEIGMLRTIEQASLPKQVRCEYNQRAPYCSHSLATRLSSRRRGSIRAVSVHLNQATSLFSHAPRTCFAMD